MDLGFIINSEAGKIQIVHATHIVHGIAWVLNVDLPYAVNKYTVMLLRHAGGSMESLLRKLVLWTVSLTLGRCIVIILINVKIYTGTIKSNNSQSKIF